MAVIDGDVLLAPRTLARLLVREGCGLIPSGAYHQDLPTTISARDFALPKRLRRARQPFTRAFG